MTDLTGKVALLTGAARRIGATTANILHDAGATIVLHYRHSAQAAQQLQTQLNQRRANSCYLVQGDLLETSTLDQLIEQTLAQTQRLDILVNNASSFYPTPMGKTTVEQWDDLFGTNAKAPFFLSQAAYPALQAHQGCVINIVDIHGSRPLKNYPVYSAAKASLIMLTQALARELAPQVRVNAVAPGAILWPEMGMNQQADNVELIAKTALKRQGSPEDIAKAVRFLAQDASYITGQVIAVDGGRLLNH
ncbi:MAG TPA: pteridine reductase [Thiothrix sp.]|nr:pteridine reductase [Thiothrix sp.]